MTELRFPPGRIIGGRFTIQAELGRGPGSVTYRAITAPNREVAVRVLDPAVPNAPGLVHALHAAHARSRTDLGRFLTAIVDSGRDDESGAPFVVVPLVMTPSLAQLVALCPFEPADAAAMIVSLGRALDALHGAGLAHLDLKPTNVFVGPAPERSVQLTDAGLHLLHGGAPGEWVAPEQAGTPGTAGPAADVFSMALVAFHALTGATLLPSASVDERRAALASRTLVGDRVRQLGLTLPPGLDVVLARGLAVAPADRPPSAGAFAAALSSALSGARPVEPAITEAQAPISLAPAITEAPPAPAITEPAPPLVEPEPVATASAGTLKLPVAPPPPPFALPVPPPPALLAREPVPSVLLAPEPVPSALIAPAASVEAVSLEAPLSSSSFATEATTKSAHGARPTAFLPREWRSRSLVLAAGGAAFVLFLGAGGLARARFSVGRGEARPAEGALASASAHGAEAAPIAQAPAPAAAPAPAPPAEEPTAVQAPSDPVVAPSEPIAAPNEAAAAPSDAPTLQLGPKKGELLVVCEPVPCHLVMLDGKPMREYPNPAVVRAGVHGIGASRSGHGGQWQQVVVPERERRTVVFKLTPSAPTAAKKPCGKFLRRCD